VCYQTLEQSAGQHQLLHNHAAHWPPLPPERTALRAACRVGFVVDAPGGNCCNTDARVVMGKETDDRTWPFAGWHTWASVLPKCLTSSGEQKNFCIIDAAMNDPPRPATYHRAFHAIVPVEPVIPEAEGDRL
jgi:hypothetical protein